MNKYFGTLVAAALAAACASHDAPPAASAATEGASSTPSSDSDMATISNDGASLGSNGHAFGNGDGAAVSKQNDMTGSEHAATDSPAPTSNAAATPTQDDSKAKPDNSRVNERDKGGKTLTPMDQGPSASDRKITQMIRQAVVKNGSLSFGAKNVKIITINGKVTLRGPVKSDDERAAIEASAKNVAGVTQVDNQLEIKE